jgi:F-type H+-transporting ATPase subunit alpha
MFYSHSSLLERAGRLASNHKSLTAIPIVLTPGGDITAYLPTNLMSITDGQWIMDMQVFRDMFRPAVNVGLSVTRVGSRGQSSRQKQQAAQVQRLIAAYTQAQEYAHFGSELALQAQNDLARGQLLYKLFNQKPDESYSLMAQQLMLDVVFTLAEQEVIDTDTLKQSVNAAASQIKSDADFDKVSSELKSKCVINSTTAKVG